MKPNQMLDTSQSTYSDETTTGASSASFRGIGRATIAARLDDKDGFNWLSKFRRDFLPRCRELKADPVIRIMDENRAAKNRVRDGIAAATIVIVDLSEHYRRILTDLLVRSGVRAPTRAEAIDVMAKQSQHLAISRRILEGARQLALYATSVPKVEGLLREVILRSGAPAGDDDILISRDALNEMNEREFQELIARFSVAFADSLAPDRQADVIASILKDQRYLDPGYLAFVTLGYSTGIDRYFDIGCADATTLLKRAHDTITQHLADARQRFFCGTSRPGSVIEEDSARLLGIQAADIAARIASIDYERYPEDRAAGAAAVRRDFDRVFVNDHWI